MSLCNSYRVSLSFVSASPGNSYVESLVKEMPAMWDLKAFITSNSQEKSVAGDCVEEKIQLFNPGCGTLYPIESFHKPYCTRPGIYICNRYFWILNYSRKNVKCHTLRFKGVSLQFIIPRWHDKMFSSTAAWRQTAVTDYFSSKQLLLFTFAPNFNVYFLMSPIWVKKIQIIWIVSRNRDS